MSDIEAQREEKQRYLRDNVDAQFYQEFAEFCTSYAGSIDIDAWTIQYVKQLVTIFNENMRKQSQEQEKNVEKSFAIYQSLPGGATQSIQNILSELEEDNQDKNNNMNQNDKDETTKQKPSFVKKDKKTVEGNSTPQRNAQQKKTPKVGKVMSPSVNSNPVDKKGSNSSAVDLLDSAFEQADKTEKKQETEINQKKVSESFFNSVNFWEVPQVNSPKRKMQQQKKASPTKIQSPKKIILNLPKEQKKQNKKNDFDAFYNTGFPASSNSQVIDSHNFSTFSIFTQQQIDKNRQSPQNNKQSKSPQLRMNSPPVKKAQKPKSQIKVVQVKDYNPSQITNNQSKITKMTSDSKVEKKRKKSKKFFSKIRYDGPKVFKNDFHDNIPCAKAGVRNNYGLQIQVKVIGHEIVQRSIFSSDYIMYKLQVEPTSKVINRNYEDFSKLRNTLNKMYPVIQLPFLQKQGWISTTSSQYAQKQGQMIQLFLADILSNGQLRNSRIIEDFLSFSEHKKIKRKFEEYEKMVKIESIQQLCLMSGNVQIQLTENQRVQKQFLGKLHDRIQNGLQKYRKLCQLLSSCYTQVISTQNNICETLKEIQDSIQDYNKRVNVKQIQNLEDSFKQIRDSYRQNLARARFERKIIDNQVLPFIKYEKQNVHIMKDLLEECNSFTNKYLKRSAYQEENKKTSYLSKSLKEHKHGILSESKNLMVFKYQTGYLQSQTSCQFKRIFEHLSKKINNKWNQIGNKYLVRFSSSSTLWNQIIFT